MAHMIDETTGRAAIAYAGQTPWHGLGQKLTPDAGIEVWTREAGLAYDVQRAPVQFTRPGDSEPAAFPERHVLYRTDTMSPLSVVGHKYQIVQPSAVMDFFRALTEHNGFQMETAGAIDGGRRIWALARVSEGAPILDADVVRPYVLLATSYDGSMSTTAKFTSIRVVCHNTLTMSAGTNGQGQTERDTAGSVVRVPHSADFDPKAVRMDLGIVFDHWERFLATTRRLARQKVSDEFTASFLKALLPAPEAETTPTGRKTRPVEQSKAYLAVMELFRGGAIGADLPEANGTAFGLLNAVTEYVDHVRGGKPENRLNSAWFGSGEGLKARALALLDKATA